MTSLGSGLGTAALFGSAGYASHSFNLGAPELVAGMIFISLLAAMGAMAFGYPSNDRTLKPAFSN